MKNKKVIYILISAVAIVWGLIIYKVAFYVKAEPEKPIMIQPQKSDNESGEIADTFSLINNYPDPFLETKYAARSDNKIKSKNTATKQSKAIQKWPEISFEGIIINKQTDKKNINISINNKSLLMTVGEEKEQVKLLKIYSDSILVEYYRNQKVIVK